MNATPTDALRLEEGITQIYIPEYMHGELRGYVLRHRAAGGFLTKLLENDFLGAVAAADTENALALQRWGQLLAQYVPSACLGSPATVRAWLKR